jgi:hypothetical protein
VAPAHKMGPLREADREVAAVVTPRELLDIDGVVAAGEFNPDGSLVDFEAKLDVSEEMAQMMAQFCATVSGWPRIRIGRSVASDTERPERFEHEEGPRPLLGPRPDESS